LTPTIGVTATWTITPSRIPEATKTLTATSIHFDRYGNAYLHINGKSYPYPIANRYRDKHSTPKPNASRHSDNAAVRRKRKAD
jgi:hypothetical protein